MPASQLSQVGLAVNGKGKRPPGGMRAVVPPGGGLLPLGLAIRSHLTPFQSESVLCVRFTPKGEAAGAAMQQNRHVGTNVGTHLTGHLESRWNSRR